MQISNRAKEFLTSRKDLHSNEMPNSPYTRAQAEWDNRIGSARVQAKNWRIVAVTALGLTIFSTAGLIYQGTQSQIVPYVVRVDQLGQAQSVGPATAQQTAPNEKEMKYFVSQFVQKTRAISSDAVVFKQNWNSVQSFLQGAAVQKMETAVRTEQFAGRIGKETIAVTVAAVLPVSSNTYQIRWQEDVFTSAGGRKESYKMSGMFTVAVSPPKDEKTILINPFGIFITDFSWSREV